MKIIPNGASRRLALSALKLQKNSPTLLLVGGLGGFVGTVVLASRATLKLGDVLDETKYKLDDIRQLRETRPATPEEEKEFKKASALFKLEAAIKITKLYGPAVIVGAASIALLVSSHNVLNKRNAGLVAAYAAIDKSFKEYRARVVADLGEEKDNEYARAVQSKRVIETDPETGKKTSVVKKSSTGGSEYARAFGYANGNWNNNAAMNMSFIKLQQSYANDQLQRKGFVLLNDVYDSLGFERTTAGAVVGWVYSGEGDGYIDFGLFDKDNAFKIAAAFEDPNEDVWLDFNVDGLVFELIDEIQSEVS